MSAKEGILFEMFKNTIATSNDIKRSRLQQKYPDVNISELHRKIVNYQIKKYGRNLCRSDFKVRSY